MRRNTKEERLKFIRREYQRWNEVDKEADKAYYIPLEQPQFAGWEVYVDLCDSGKRRRDAVEIQAVLDILGWSKPHFVRNLMTIRYIRIHKYRYDRVTTYHSKKSYANCYAIRDKYSNRISEQDYRKIPEKYKHLFTKHNESYFWGDKTYYTVRYGVIPTYELVFKVKKAYWTQLKYYDGDAQGEAQRLRDKVWEGSYSPLVPRAMGFESRYRDDHRRSIKCNWRCATKKILKAANGLGVNHEEWDDVETELKTRSKVYKHKAFGWD